MNAEEQSKLPLWVHFNQHRQARFTVGAIANLVAAMDVADRQKTEKPNKADDLARFRLARVSTAGIILHNEFERPQFLAVCH